MSNVIIFVNIFFSSYTNFTTNFFCTNFFGDMKPETFRAINKEPYREFQNGNDKGQRNACTPSNIAHFYISVIDQKSTTIFLEVEMNSCI